MKTVDEECIAAFLAAKIKELKSKAPGYVCISVDVKHHKSSAKSEVTYRAYCEHVGHSNHHDNVDAAIAEVVSRVSGKTEPEMLREKAHHLLNEAKRLEEQEA